MSKQRSQRAAVQVPGEALTTIGEGSEMGEGLDLDAVGEPGTYPEAGEPNAGDEQTQVEESTESDVDAALAAAQAGGTHKIAKPKPAVEPAKLPRPDPSRPPMAAVNQRPTMRYAEAMEMLEKGELKRSVLTEHGWVAVSKEPPPENKR